MSEFILHCPEDSKYEPDPRGLAAVLFDAIKANANKIAQIDGDTGEKQTYAEMHLEAIRVAQHMQQMGIKPKDVVSVCCYNTLESYVAFLATIYTGALIASLDPTIPPAEAEHLLKQVDPKFIFCGPESLEIIEKICSKTDLKTKIISFGPTTKYVPYSKLLESTGNEENFKPYVVKDLFETAVIFFSSGTTGLPKGICSTHYGLLAKFDSRTNSSKFNGHNLSVFLYYTTIYWISAVAVTILAALRGSARVLGKKFDPHETYSLIKRHKVTTMFLSPYLMNLWIKHSEPNKDISTLTTLVVGGGYIAAEQVKALMKKMPGTNIFNIYGLTEAHGALTAFDVEDPEEKEMMRSNPKSVGRLLPGITCKLVDLETDKICGPNEPGEIRVKAKSLMSGYYKRPKESAEAWDIEGYLRTGDIGYYDEQHCFYIVDRAKEMFKFQGWHITPADLEAILLTHPDVQEAAVIGVDHVDDGEWPMGVVVRRPGSTVTENDILTFFNGQVADRKKLRGGIQFVDSLPYTPTGKLQRRFVKQQFKHLKFGTENGFNINHNTA